MKYTEAGVFQFSNTNIECIRYCIGGRGEGEGLTGSLSRDFQLQFFFHKSVSPWPPECPIVVISNVLQKFTEIFTIFHGDLLLLIITGVADTSD
jgi:hypothetical protein